MTDKKKYRQKFHFVFCGIEICQMERVKLVCYNQILDVSLHAKNCGGNCVFVCKNSDNMIYIRLFN